jgi:hypothetical protein
MFKEGDDSLVAVKLVLDSVTSLFPANMGLQISGNIQNQMPDGYIGS